MKKDNEDYLNKCMDWIIPVKKDTVDKLIEFFNKNINKNITYDTLNVSEEYFDFADEFYKDQKKNLECYL